VPGEPVEPPEELEMTHDSGERPRRPAYTSDGWPGWMLSVALILALFALVIAAGAVALLIG
jgi:hypothetical protein